MSNKIKDLRDYYLDINELKKLSKEESERIHNYYIIMLDCDYSQAKQISIFNTLEMGGFIKNINQEKRSRKLDQIIEE